MKNKHTPSQSSRKPGVGNITRLSDDWDASDDAAGAASGSCDAAYMRAWLG